MALASSPLDLASLGGRQNEHRVARLLIEHGSNPNTRGMVGLTPLHRASKGGRIEVLRLLIKHGASVEVKYGRGKTSLDVASGEVIRLLSEHLAN